MYKTIIISLLLLVGCNFNKIENNISEVYNQNSKISYKSSEDRAKTIVEQVQKLKEVKKTSVVIMGSFVIVGLDLSEQSENINDYDLIKLKSKISKLVKEIDIQVKQVSITTAPDLVNKVNNIADFTADDKKIKLPKNSEDEVIKLTPIL